MALKPLGASGTSVLLTNLTTALPNRCRNFFAGEKEVIFSTGRSPMTTSAFPARIGATSAGMSAAMYWLSASVLTMMSAPSLTAASRPARKALASP